MWGKLMLSIMVTVCVSCTIMCTIAQARRSSCAINCRIWEIYIFSHLFFIDSCRSGNFCWNDIKGNRFYEETCIYGWGYEFYTFFQPIRIQKCLPMTVSDIICLLNQQSAQVVVIVLILSINFMFVFYLSCSHLFLWNPYIQGVSMMRDTGER